jgi:hypothetical protein
LRRFVRGRQGLAETAELFLHGAEEYVRIGAVMDDSNMFAVLRTLFEVPDPPGYLEPPMLGAPIPEMPTDLRRVPRFPIAIQDDIPFLITMGYSLFGKPETPQWRAIPYFREHGVMRSKPLVPTTRPFDAIDRLAHSPQWLFHGDAEMSLAGPARGRALLMNQVLHMADTVYRPAAAKEPYGLYQIAKSSGGLRRIVDGFNRLKIRWDARRMIYTFADGTTLPERKAGE